MIANFPTYLRRLALVVTALCLPLFSSACTEDGPPPRDGDMKLTWQKVKPQDNGYTHLMEISEIYKKSTDRKEKSSDVYRVVANMINNRSKWGAKDLAELKQSFGKEFVVLEKFLKAKVVQVPKSELHFEGKIPNLLALRTMANILHLSSRLHLRQGKGKKAWEEAWKIFQFSHQMLKGQGALIQAMIGKAIHSIGLKALREVIHSGKVSSADVKPYLAKLASHKGHVRKAVAQAFKAEYHSQKRMVRMMASGKYSMSKLRGRSRANSRQQQLREQLEREALKQGFLFQPNNTLRVSLKFMRTAVKATQMDWRGLKHTERQTRRWVEKMQSQLRGGNEAEQFLKMVKLFIEGNAIGKVLLAIAIPNVVSAAKTALEGEVQLSGTLAVAALYCYKKDKGSLPASLDDLVKAGYLKRAPHDSYVKKPLQYNQKEGYVRSKGYDFEQQGVRGRVNLKRHAERFTFYVSKK